MAVVGVAKKLHGNYLVGCNRKKGPGAKALR